MLVGQPVGSMRAPGGGRPPVEKKTRARTGPNGSGGAGNRGRPDECPKWVRSSLRHLSTRLTAQGNAVSHQTVGRLLDQLGYALHVNAEKLEASARHPTAMPSSGAISRPKRGCVCRRGVADHQRRHQEEGADRRFQECRRRLESGSRRRQCACTPHPMPKAGPCLTVSMTSPTIRVPSMSAPSPTRQFAVECDRPLVDDGRPGAAWPGRALADLGRCRGSNGCRPRLWKQQLQEQLCDRLGLTVTVVDHPTGALEVESWSSIAYSAR